MITTDDDDKEIDLVRDLLTALGHNLTVQCAANPHWASALWRWPAPGSSK